MNIPELLKTVEEAPKGTNIFIGSDDEYRESLDAICKHFKVIAYTHHIIGHDHYIMK